MENQFDLFSPLFARNGVTIFMKVSNCRKEMSSRALFFSCLLFGILFLGIFELGQKPLTTLKYKLESFLLMFKCSKQNLDNPEYHCFNIFVVYVFES
jgi:hypothetical protein